jgi:carbon storage regulator
MIQGRSSAISFLKEDQMLVLSRKKDQFIVVGDNIRIVVVEIRKDKVRIGVEAPKDVKIDREEIWLKIKEEQDGGT